MHENVPVVRLLLACATQWRTGFAGATGLDYNALFAVAGALRVTIDEIMLHRIAAVESLTLEYWRKRQKEKPASPPPGQRPVRRRR